MAKFIIIEIQQVVSQNYIRELIFSIKLVLTSFKVTSGQICREKLKKVRFNETDKIKVDNNALFDKNRGTAVQSRFKSLISCRTEINGMNILY